jgi:hypothetical protein
MIKLSIVCFDFRKFRGDSLSYHLFKIHTGHLVSFIIVNAKLEIFVEEVVLKVLCGTLCKLCDLCVSSYFFVTERATDIHRVTKRKKYRNLWTFETSSFQPLICRDTQWLGQLPQKKPTQLSQLSVFFRTIL